MMRACLAMVCLASLIGSGCAAADHSRKGTVCLSSPNAGQHAALAAALLFDRRPGPYDASDFAFRSQWPSTVSFYSPGQVIYYRERLTDYQGQPFGAPDYTLRYFSSYRTSIGYR
jgi:hypothetical protein